MILDIYLLILLSILISYTPFVKKILLKTFSFDEILWVQFLFVQIPLVMYCAYKYLFTTTKMSFLKKITYTHISCIMLMLITSIIGTSIYYTLIKKSQVSNIVPILSPLIIIFTLLIGFLYFKEKLKKNEIIGICTIVIGIFVIKSTYCKRIFNKI